MCIDCCQYRFCNVRLLLQNFPVMIWLVLLANQGTHWPIACRDKAGLLVPGVIDQAISVGRFLPIIDLVARYASLKDEVRVASHGVEWIVLHRPQALHYAREISRREMVERE